MADSEMRVAAQRARGKARAMKVDEGKYSVAEIVEWLRTRQLVANNEYQRGSGLWPNAAKSYFIDTVLKNFPFPKVYFSEKVDKDTKRPKREIVDGQQRLATILEFVDGKFALGENAAGLAGKKFDDLTEDEQNAFFGYTVSVDVIRNADRTEILQMFRRMNAFTLPLNAAEKRHSEFFGQFKDWINTALDRLSAVFIDWKILTSRQVVRMADAEFVADIVLAIEEGIVSTSPAKLRGLYKKYDEVFDQRGQFDERVSEVFAVIVNDLSPIQGTYITKPHVFHSLVCALLHNKFGLANSEGMTGISPTGAYYADRDKALVSLRRLAAAHEEKDVSVFGDYVKAASEGGNRAAQRATRISWLCRALAGEFA